MIKAFLRRQTMQFIVTIVTLSAQTAHNIRLPLHLERGPAVGLGHALDGLDGAVERDAGRGVGGGGGAEQRQQQQQQHGDTERAADTLTLGRDYYTSTIQFMHLCIVLIKSYLTHFPHIHTSTKSIYRTVRIHCVKRLNILTSACC